MWKHHVNQECAKDNDWINCRKGYKDNTHEKCKLKMMQNEKHNGTKNQYGNDNERK